MIQTLTCPGCAGRGDVFYICGNRRITCWECKGSGKVQRDPAWAETGVALRHERAKRDMSLGEAARAIGAKPLDLSAAEHGRSDGSALLQALREARP